MVVGTQCPSLEGLQFLKGDPVPVPTPGKVTVIELWAKWCGPCRQVFPHLTALYQARKAKGLVVVGVSIEDDPSLPAFVRSQGNRMGYTVAVDPVGAAMQLMQRAGVSGIPHAFVVDTAGAIAYSGHPAQPDFEAAMDTALAAAPAAEQVPLPLITETADELAQRPVKELKGILQERGLSIVGITEKSELVDLIDKQCRTITYYKQ